VPYSHAKVELDKLPVDIKECVIHIAKQHNALVDGTNDMKLDLDMVTGSTPEGKAEMHLALSIVRKVVHGLHSKRFSVSLATFQIYATLAVLKQLGVTPEHLSKLGDILLKILQKATET
jgi:hypothetical protein